MVSDVFKREETNFRLPFRDMLQWIAVLRRSRDGDEGIVYGDGRKWREQRRFALATLRDFGFGKSSMEDLGRDSSRLNESSNVLSKYRIHELLCNKIKKEEVSQDFPIELPPQINEEVACFCQHLAELREGAENGVLTVKVGILPFLRRLHLEKKFTPFNSEPAKHTDSERPLEDHRRAQVRLLGPEAEARPGHGRRHHVRHGAQGKIHL